jgi:hypothetical protein
MIQIGKVAGTGAAIEDLIASHPLMEMSSSCASV